MSADRNGPNPTSHPTCVDPLKIAEQGRVVQADFVFGVYAVAWARLGV
jgi:hypothetical protein